MTRQILVLDRLGAFTTDVARAARRLDPPALVVRVNRPAAGVEEAERARADVIVAAPEEMTRAGLRRLARIHRADPRTVVLLATNGRPLTPEEVAACGAGEVVHYPAGTVKLRNALRRSLDVAAELRPTYVPADPPGPATPTQSHVYTVTSASGGCGKTFYATNFASYLAKATGGRVLLVDLDLQFGEVSVSLQLRPQLTIAEATETDDIQTVLGDAVMTHEAGFDVLCAPMDPISADRVGPREATVVLEWAQRHYEHVVVDTPPALNEVVLAAFDLSHSLIVLATMDIPSLKNLKVFLKTLDRLKLDASDVTLVLNKEQQGTGIELDQVQRIYGFSTVLPFAPEVTRSINAGRPVLNSDPGAPVTVRFVEGARRLVPPHDGVELPWGSAVPGHGGGWLRKLLRKGARR